MRDFRNRVGVNPTPVAVPRRNSSRVISATPSPVPKFCRSCTIRHHDFRSHEESVRAHRSPQQHRSHRASIPSDAKIVALAQTAMTSLCARTSSPELTNTGSRTTTSPEAPSIRITKYSIKIDHSLNEKNRFSGYFGYSEQNSVPGPDGPPGIAGIWNPFQYSSNTSPVYRGSWDYTINAHITIRSFRHQPLRQRQLPHPFSEWAGRLHPQRIELQPDAAGHHHQ